MHNEYDLPQHHQALQWVLCKGVELRPGDRVRLCPEERADVMEKALSGKTATIASIEQDFENRVHLGVTIDDEPGDEGATGKSGDRLFFSPNEVQRIHHNPQ